MRVARLAALLALAVVIAVAVASRSGSASSSPTDRAQFDASPRSHLRLSGIHKIRHVVIIMQENRSFDSYFGTFPGADGIPGLAGNPGTVPCLPDPRYGGCDVPFHDPRDRTKGGIHTFAAAQSDIDGGAMDGFVSTADQPPTCASHPNAPNCSEGTSAIMGYHTGADIPNYWTYARDFVLADHMFESVSSWSLPSHLYLLSGWSASCTDSKPQSCSNAPEGPGDHSPYAWTDITYLLHKYRVSWRYYVMAGKEPDCPNGANICAGRRQGAKTPGIWNPLHSFTDVKQDGQLKNIQTLADFYAQAQAGTLPAVSWLVPNGRDSEHPPNSIAVG